MITVAIMVAAEQIDDEIDGSSEQADDHDSTSSRLPIRPATSSSSLISPDPFLFAMLFDLAIAEQFQHTDGTVRRDEGLASPVHFGADGFNACPSGRVVRHEASPRSVERPSSRSRFSSPGPDTSRQTAHEIGKIIAHARLCSRIVSSAR